VQPGSRARPAPEYRAVETWLTTTPREENAAAAAAAPDADSAVDTGRNAALDGAFEFSHPRNLTQRPDSRFIPGRIAVILLLWVSAAVTVLYWVVFFTSGAVHSTAEECYLTFERAFPLADGWLTTLCLVAAEGLRRQREWAVLAGVAAGSALVYLGGMDVLYNLENGMYARMNAAMAGEVAINLWSGTFGPFLIAYFWRQRRRLRLAMV